MFNRKKKSETDIFKEWFDKAKRQVSSKNFIVLWVDLENQKDMTCIDGLISKGYELITIYSVFGEGKRIVLKKPTDETIGDAL